MIGIQTELPGLFDGKQYSRFSLQTIQPLWKSPMTNFELKHPTKSPTQTIWASLVNDTQLWHNLQQEMGSWNAEKEEELFEFFSDFELKECHYKNTNEQRKLIEKFALLVTLYDYDQLEKKFNQQCHHQLLSERESTSFSRRHTNDKRAIYAEVVSYGTRQIMDDDNISERQLREDNFEMQMNGSDDHSETMMYCNTSSPLTVYKQVHESLTFANNNPDVGLKHGKSSYIKVCERGEHEEDYPSTSRADGIAIYNDNKRVISSVYSINAKQTGTMEGIPALLFHSMGRGLNQKIETSSSSMSDTSSPEIITAFYYTALTLVENGGNNDFLAYYTRFNLHSALSSFTRTSIKGMKALQRIDEYLKRIGETSNLEEQARQLRNQRGLSMASISDGSSSSQVESSSSSLSTPTPSSSTTTPSPSTTTPPTTRTSTTTSSSSRTSTTTSSSDETSGLDQTDSDASRSSHMTKLRSVFMSQLVNNQHSRDDHVKKLDSLDDRYRNTFPCFTDCCYLLRLSTITEADILQEPSLRDLFHDICSLCETTLTITLARTSDPASAIVKLLEDSLGVDYDIKNFDITSGRYSRITCELFVYAKIELEQEKAYGRITFYRNLALAMIIKDVDCKNDELIASSLTYPEYFDHWISHNTRPRDEQDRYSHYFMQLKTLAEDSAEYLICYKYGVRMRATSDISFQRNQERNIESVNRIRAAYIQEIDRNRAELPTTDAQPKKKKKKKSLLLS